MRREKTALVVVLFALGASCAEPSVRETIQDGHGGAAGMQAGAAAAGGPADAGVAGGGGAAGTIAGEGATGGAGGQAAGGAGGTTTTADAAIGGGVDGGHDAGSAPPGCPAASVCESFDAMPGPQLDGALWQVVTPDCSGTGAVALDRDVVHGGTQSVRVSGGGGFCNHLFIQPTALVPPLPDPLYARFFLRLEAALTSEHVTFVALHDGADGSDLRMGGQSEILMWNRESDDATLPELSPTGVAVSVRPQAQSWICVEFMIDASARTLRTWVDGEAVPALQVEGEATQDIDGQWLRKTDWQPQLQDVKLGWESYGDDTNTLWFDDFAVGPARFGCTP